MNQAYGTHEVMEVHEVLNNSIKAINQFKLYLPFCQDDELRQILDRQLRFMLQEYNSLVQLISHKTGAKNSVYEASKNITPVYGLDNPTQAYPNTSTNQMNDQDVASGMLGAHKAGASFRMRASLECADPHLRRAISQGAINCSEKAYEVWGYMNKRGYYQVPTLMEKTTQTVMNSYKPNTSKNHQAEYQPVIPHG